MYFHIVALFELREKGSKIRILKRLYDGSFSLPQIEIVIILDST